VSKAATTTALVSGPQTRPAPARDVTLTATITSTAGVPSGTVVVLPDPKGQLTSDWSDQETLSAGARVNDH